MAVQQERKMVTDYGDPAVTGGISVFSREFDKAYRYDGNDLGSIYSPEQTQFRLWAPTASEAKVRLYPNTESESFEEFVMTRSESGTWVLTVKRDLDQVLYTFVVRIGSNWNEAVDPYAKAVGINGDKGVILDLQQTNPPRWTPDKPSFVSPTDAVIYEVHIGDFSLHPESGIQHKGKYLGFTETGTRGPQGILTGLDHLKHLGITHVQLLPVQDFAKASVDEEKTAATGKENLQYNWGYDPKNFNAPEGSYASNPFQPGLRIRELKQAVQALHEQGLRVILDVVYNHVYDGYIAHFTKLVPGYYLRYKKDGSFSNGSGCGNDCASERFMMSKYIIDSVVYWATEYRVDGFRFDLMGLLDVDTMNEIRRRLDEIDPSILVLGEGWIMETELQAERRANLQQAGRMPGIAHFNGELRNALKGDIFKPDQTGFVSRGKGLEPEIMKGVVGSISYNNEVHGFASEPTQCVNFAECHDNHTLWDKLSCSAAKADENERRRMQRLAAGIVLTSQGIPFLHAGQEFLRTKGGMGNSYQAPPAVNQLDWSRCAAYQDEVEAIRKMIELRKRHPAFRLKTAAEISRHLRFEPTAGAESAVAFTLREHAGGDPARNLYVLYHASSSSQTFSLPELGKWEVAFGEDIVTELHSGHLNVKGIGMVVLSNFL
ncbi:type I pullulanase [Paenibacillus vini]|uniref:type I pullulanase n=1 Tax=Paenibacillus vini TaxID=1476024 RepID=UPI0025B6F03C|nr:type I pullulanase [Paenibacillus vini]MDN4070504.1 type I pullulanase [Paenibacillus vini]